MKHTYNIIWAIIALLCMTGCNNDDTVYPPRHIKPLYIDIARYASLDSVQRYQLLDSDSLMIKAYMAVLGGDYVSDSLLCAISRSKPIETFTPEVEKAFPTLEPVEQALGYFLGSAAEQGLSIKKMEYGAVVWGWNQSIVFYDDEIMLIALNHYLGADHEAYRTFPLYRRMVKTPKNLYYDIAESLIAQSYPFEETSQSTILSYMLYDGAITYIKMLTVQDPNEATAMGFDDSQIQWLKSNEGRIWRTMITQNLIYDTSSFVKDRLMNPAPSTDIINSAAPGRVGRYIGYSMVCSYMAKHKDTKLTFLLSPAFYNGENTLASSGYAPK